jgi:hypothetical protein
MKKIVSLPKYYKRMISFMPKGRGMAFKELMLSAISEEKSNKEQERKTKKETK